MPSQGPAATQAVNQDFVDTAHLLRRSGFGATRGDVEALLGLPWADKVARVLDTSGPALLPPQVPDVPNLDPNRGWSERYNGMVHYWLDRARLSSSPIVEKMVLFWSGHLCSGLSKVYEFPQLFEQNQVFRRYGMGDYEELLQRVAVGPAMLWYLDNKDNHAAEPNENFARELMELFTLGTFNGYGESDVRASARAWTGHGVTEDRMRYVFDNNDHDNGNKTFMGSSRNWNGPDIIHHILTGPTAAASARFMANKLWSFFAYPFPDQAVVNSIADVYLANGRRIDATLSAIFNHPEFRSNRARSALVRSPIEYVVAIMRHVNMPCSLANPQWLLGKMGQTPFNPPNVAGWRQNEYWISPTATWAKHSFASNVRWRADDDEALLGGSYATTADLNARVDEALDKFGIFQPSPRTRATLFDYVANEPRTWARRSGLLLLTPLAPEMQMA